MESERAAHGRRHGSAVARWQPARPAISSRCSPRCQLGTQLRLRGASTRWGSPRRCSRCSPSSATARSAREPAAQSLRAHRPALAEADMDQGPPTCMGDESAAKSLERLSRAHQACWSRQGLVENKEGKLELTPTGPSASLGSNKRSDELFSKMAARTWLGQPRVVESSGHRSRAHLRHQGVRVRRSRSSSHLRSHRSAMRSAEPLGHGRIGCAGATCTPDDFEIERTEHLRFARATVLMLDLSLSMPMRDNFLPAKKVAMALSLTSSRPSSANDYLGIVGFSETAKHPHRRTSSPR